MFDHPTAPGIPPELLAAKEGRPPLRDAFEAALQRIDREIDMLGGRMEPFLRPLEPTPEIATAALREASPFMSGFSGHVEFLNVLANRIADLNRRFEY